MTEPTYEYIKGQGWVVFNGEIHEVTNQWGTWHLENRLPKPGERYAMFAKSDEKYVLEDRVDLITYGEYLKALNDWNQYAYDGWTPPKNCFICVLSFTPNTL